MIKKKQTDRIIRNKLKYHASPSPDHLWDAIDAELPLNKKRIGGFWWNTSGLVGSLLLIAIAAFVLLKNEEPVNPRNESLGLVPSPDVVIQNNEANSVMPSVQNNKTTSILLSEESQEKITKKKDEPLAENKWITKEVVKKEDPKRSVSTSSNLSTIAAEVKYFSKSINAGASLLNKEKGAVVPQDFQTGWPTSSSTFSFLDLPTESILVDNTKKEKAWPSLMVAPKCATFGKWLKLYFYGDLYFSPDISFRKLESKGTDYDLYTANRKATESQILSYSAGARFSIVSNYGLALRTGVVYSQINEVFDYQSESETRTTFVETFDNDGNLIRTDTIIETGSLYKKTYNRYRMVDVPILLGYELNFKKFTLALNSGIYANISSRQKGDFLSPDLKPVTFTSDSENTYPAFRERLNLSIYGSLAFMYNLNERWQLMLEPQFRYYLDPMTIPEYMVEQKYVTTGLITGLRYRF